jgi:pyruvate dehydrogenase E1 component alpha subunit
LIEAKTFRFNGHTLGDPSEYIPKDVMSAARQRDPIVCYRKSLLDRGIADEALLTGIVKTLSDDVNEAMTFALNAPWPVEQELARDTYQEELAL